MTTQAVFLDMDGTILNEDNRVTNHTNDVIQEVRQKGIKVFIATGRAYDEIPYLVPENFEVDGILSSNGAVGYINGEEIFRGNVMVEMIREVFGVYDEVNLNSNTEPLGEANLERFVESESVEHSLLDIKKFNKVMEDAEKELYLGCKDFTKLSFLLHLYHVKCLYG